MYHLQCYVCGCDIKTYFLLLLLYVWNLHDNIFFSTLRSIASDVRVQLNHPPVQLEHTFQHYVHAKRLPTVGTDIKVSFTTRGPTEDVLPYPVCQSTKGTERTEVTHLLYAYKITVEHASALIIKCEKPWMICACQCIGWHALGLSGVNSWYFALQHRVTSSSVG